MMRTTKLFLLQIATMLLVAACSPSADFSTDCNGNAVQFASVEVSNDGVYTRSATTVTTGKLGVFRTTHNNYTVQNNVEYGYDGSIWISAVPMAVGSASAHLGIYYPYQAAGITYASNPGAITITSQKYTKEQDLCYSTLNDVSSSNYKLNPVLKHAYAKLTFVIRKKDATYSSSCAVSNISISHANILKTNTISIIKGTYGSGMAGTLSYDPGIASVALGDSAVTSALMVPVTKPMSGNITLSFTIDGYKTSATMDAVDSGLTTMEAGKNYVIPVTISGKQLIITKVTVNPWSTGHTCSADLPKPPPPVIIVNAQPESNCYMVQPGTTISIPVSRVTTAGITILTSTWSAGVLWAEDTSINGIARNENYIQLTAGSTDGNAVVFIKDSNGTIIWSWHIWVTNYNPNTDNFTVNGYKWMKRNLGALSYDTDESCFGLHYQWGRKDPFDNVVSTGNVTGVYNLVTKPDIFSVNSNPDAGGWSEIVKTNFDPCPLGWKIPPVVAWETLIDLKMVIDKKYDYGYYFPDNYGFGFFPFCGEISKDGEWSNSRGGAESYVLDGYYWTSNDTRGLFGIYTYLTYYSKIRYAETWMLLDWEFTKHSAGVRCVKE